MKSYLLAFAVLFAFQAVSLAEGPATKPQTSIDDGSFEAFFPTNSAYRVTIRSETGLVSVLEVPKTVRLGVYGAAGASFVKAEALGGPTSFDGNLTLRLRRDDKRETGQSDSALDIMAKAPFVLKLSNVSVVAEVVEK